MGDLREREIENGRLLVSRRAFLYGAAAGAAAIGIGASATLAGCGQKDEAAEAAAEHLEVPESSLVTLNEFEALDSPDSKVQLTGVFDLPYATLVWASDEEVAACLLPTDSGAPLTKVGVLHLGNGALDTVLERAVGFPEHYEVYDVRATSAGIAWTEANVLKGTWRVYTAPLAAGGLASEPVLAEEGDSSYATPTLAVAQGRAFWQVVPKQTGTGLASRLMSVQFGKSDASIVYENVRKMSTPPYACADSITIAPRLDMASVYHQLTNIDAKSGNVKDTLTLPASMTPLEAGYGDNGFMFSLADIYDLTGAIANLGTYTPLTKASGSSYADVRWFGFARTPSAPPAWCNGLLIVKSSYSVCGVDFDEGTYFAIDVDDGADDYGDYLATTGSRSSFVTYSNIDHQPIGADAIHACRVKVWTTLA